MIYVTNFFVRKRIYYIQNSNSWLFYVNHKETLINNLLSWTSTFFKKRMLKSAYQIFVANDNLQKYLKNNGIENIINIIPYKFFDIQNYNKINNIDKINIIIPGAIDLSKKDLPLIRKAFNIVSNNIQSKIKIILLGRPSKYIDKQFCEDWKNEIGDSLEYFEKFISDEEFSQKLKESHYVLGILEINYEDKYNKEIYGVTKDTGVDAQAIAYGKPLIINADFNVSKEIKSSTLKFKNAEDLADILTTAVNNNNYSDIQEKALYNCKKLSLNNIKNNLKGI
jgi:hypothetical protein